MSKIKKEKTQTNDRNKKRLIAILAILFCAYYFLAYYSPRQEELAFFSKMEHALDGGKTETRIGWW